MQGSEKDALGGGHKEVHHGLGKEVHKYNHSGKQGKEVDDEKEMKEIIGAGEEEEVAKEMMATMQSMNKEHICTKTAMHYHFSFSTIFYGLCNFRR